MAESPNNAGNPACSSRQEPVPLCMAKKWLPVTHRHGCAVYWHQNTSGEQTGIIGGEVMVSSIIRGTPQQCLDALLSSRCGNSLLGPVTDTTVIQQQSGRDTVLRLNLAPPCPNNSNSSSSASRAKGAGVLTQALCTLLRPRVAVLHQTVKQDQRGITCITFRSTAVLPCSDALVGQQAQLQQQQTQTQQQQQCSRCTGHRAASGSSSCTNHSCPGAAHTGHMQQEQQWQHQQQLQPGLVHRKNSSSSSSSNCHRSSSQSAPGALMAQQQQPQRQVQLHACCHGPGDSSSCNSTSSGANALQQQQQQQPLDTHSAQHKQQLPNQQQCVAAPLLLRPLLWLLGCIYRLCAVVATVLGLRSCSSSSRSSGGWGVWGPVLVDVVGGFTVAGLDASPAAGAFAAGAGDTAVGEASADGTVSETLVTSIVKVDWGGCLSAGAGSCLLLHAAAVRLGVVDMLMQQVLSAVERVKAEVENGGPPEHVHDLHAQQHQQHRVSQEQHSSGQHSMLRGVLSTCASVAAAALAPLTDWQTARQHQRQQQQQHRPHKHKHQQQPRSPTPVVPPQQVPAARSASALGNSSGGQAASVSVAHAVGANGSSIGGSRVSVSSSAAGAAAAECPAPEAAVAVAAVPADDMVAIGRDGQPLRGLCNPVYWSPLHEPGWPHLFQVRGGEYLSSRVKQAAGDSAYTLLSVDLVSTHTAVHHLGQFLPTVRRCRAASAIVVNMMVPAADDVMNLVMTWGSSRPWPVQPGGTKSSSNSSSSSKGSSLQGGSSSSSSSNNSINSSGNNSSSGFEAALCRFLQADDTQRSNMFKMIPHIEVGPWVLKSMVGTTPVIMGRKLQTTYHVTERYIEVDIDVTTCRTAGFIVQSIRGATTSLVVDLSYLLEGQRPAELPEQLIGAVRFSNIDMSDTTPIDTSKEVPSWPEPW